MALSFVVLLETVSNLSRVTCPFETLCLPQSSRCAIAAVGSCVYPSLDGRLQSQELCLVVGNGEQPHLLLERLNGDEGEVTTNHGASGAKMVCI